MNKSKDLNLNWQCPSPQEQAFCNKTSKQQLLPGGDELGRQEAADLDREHQTLTEYSVPKSECNIIFYGIFFKQNGL